MILVISDNDTIIGSDKEFLNNKSFEELKSSISEIDIIKLQTEVDNFEFTLNNKEYSVTKTKILTENGYMNLFNFKLIKSLSSSESDFQIEPVTSPEPELSFNPVEEEPKSDFQIEPITSDNSNNNIENDEEIQFDLGFSLSDTDTNEEEPLTSPEPELSFNPIEDEPKSDFQIEPVTSPEPEFSFNPIEEESKSDFQIEPTPDNAPEKEEELDFGLETEPEPKKPVTKMEVKNMDIGEEIELDFGIVDETENKIEIDKKILEFLSLPKNELDIFIHKELEQAAKDLSIDMDTINEFFDEFIQQVKDEQEFFENEIASQNYEDLHKSAHKLKGVALNLRLEKFGELFKTIDNLSKQRVQIDKIKELIDKLYQFMNKLQVENGEESDIQLQIDKNVSKEDLEITLSAVNEFLEDIKSESVEKMKQELLTIYNTLHIENLKKAANSLNKKNELLTFIEHIQSIIKKEIQ
jgi:HPt (histidine-containing phosphotransfer) domain-containing protein